MGDAYNFRQAVASEAKPLVGLYAESGTGKTKSSLLLAKGFAGDMAKVGMIETESGRGEAYADDDQVGGYRVLPLREDFSPRAYGAAIAAAERAQLQALIIDSASHEWEGVGGVLDMAAKNKESGSKGVLVWQQPKILHKREFMLRLMQTPIPLVIVCMRAKYPMKEATREDVAEWRERGRPGKVPSVGDWIRSDRLEPTQADDILYEMFVHGWIDHDHRFHGTKYTVDKLRQVLVDGERIDVATGQRLAAWAAGRATSTAPRQSPEPARAGPSPDQGTLATAASGAGLALPNASERDALLIKAREWAECGLAKYGDFWSGLTQEQKNLIGPEQHSAFNKIAKAVPT
jgi:hypothetical protein